MATAVPALKKIIKQKLSGRLVCEEIFDPAHIFKGSPKDSYSSLPPLGWIIYLGDGNVHFATTTVGQSERLEYINQVYCPNIIIPPLPAHQSDYEFLCELWQNQHLSLQDFRQLAFIITQEAMVNILSIRKVKPKFSNKLRISELVLSTSIQPLVSPVTVMISQWRDLRKVIGSPLNRINLLNSESLYKHLWQQFSSGRNIEIYRQVLTKKYSFYEAAGLLKTDVIQLGNLLLPLVESGTIEIIPYFTKTKKEEILIACVDSDQNFQQNIRLTLEQNNYSLLTILRSSTAITTLIEQQPQLLLIEWDMPEVSGAELCAIVRNSLLIKNLPIIILSSKDSLIDRMKVKMAGASDFLPKPFTPSQLIAMVNKHIHGYELSSGFLNHNISGFKKE